MMIRIGRTIFVLLVTLSVATLPAAVGFAAGTKTTEMSVSGTTPDCDHRHHHNAPSDQTQKTAHDEACMTACAVACFGFSATELPGIAFPSPIGTALRFVRTSDHVSSQIGNLPFRPPRS